MKRVLNFLVLFRRERRPGDLVFAAVFLIFALFMLVVLPTQAQFLGKTVVVAEPGFWPLVAVLMMVGFGAVHCLSTFNAPRLPGRWREVLVWLRSLEYVGWFILYVFAVPVAGYLPVTVIFALLLAYRLGYRSLLWLLCAAGFGALVVIVFKAGLGVRIPAGAVYEYLPVGLRTFFMVNF